MSRGSVRLVTVATAAALVVSVTACGRSGSSSSAPSSGSKPPARRLLPAPRRVRATSVISRRSADPATLPVAADAASRRRPSRSAPWPTLVRRSRRVSAGSSFRSRRRSSSGATLPAASMAERSMLTEYDAKYFNVAQEMINACQSEFMLVGNGNAGRRPGREATARLQAR